MPKNVQTTSQLHSSHTLAKYCSKFSKPAFNSTWTGNFQVFKLDFEKAEEPQIANICWITEKAREFQKNIYICFIDYAQAFDCVDHNKSWKILQEMEIPDHLTCLLRNLYAGQEETELDMEQQTGSKSGKQYIKAVYCHPALCRVHHVKCWAGWLTSWNQDCWEKYQ